MYIFVICIVLISNYILLVRVYVLEIWYYLLVFGFYSDCLENDLEKKYKGMFMNFIIKWFFC